jgi:hypothetical protein
MTELPLPLSKQSEKNVLIAKGRKKNEKENYRNFYVYADVNNLCFTSVWDSACK